MQIFDFSFFILSEERRVGGQFQEAECLYHPYLKVQDAHCPQGDSGAQKPRVRRKEEAVLNGLSP
jgi:hypothetical protein